MFRRCIRINNFPEDMPISKRWFYNVLTFLTDVTIFPRTYNLWKHDYTLIRLLLRIGDIVIMGDLSTTYGSFCGDSVTHSSIYIGKGRLIHSSGNGVSKVRLKEFLKHYETLIIFRIPKDYPKRKRIIKRVIKFAKLKLGSPYNFEFKKSKNSFFCTQLVNESFKNSGYDTGLDTYKSETIPKGRLQRFLQDKINILRPTDFIRSNFKIVFKSNNLDIKKGELVLKEKYK